MYIMPHILGDVPRCATFLDAHQGGNLSTWPGRYDLFGR